MDEKYLYKFNPRWLVQNAITKIGDVVDPASIFKKTSRGLLIHSSKYEMQTVFGVFIFLMLNAILGHFHTEVFRSSDANNWSNEKLLFIRACFWTFEILISLGSLFIITICRETYYDPLKSKITIVNKLFFIRTKRKYEKSQIKRIVLETRYDSKKDKRPFWNIKLELLDGTSAQILLKVFSDGRDPSAKFLPQKNMDGYRVFRIHPSTAWALSRASGIPISLKTQTYEIDISSSSQVLISDSEKQEMTAIHKEETQKDIIKYLKYRKIQLPLLGVAFTVMFIIIGIVGDIWKISLTFAALLDVFAIVNYVRTIKQLKTME